MKTVNESMVIMNELVLPNDTNFMGNLMGGKLMYWMDIAAAMSAMKHSNSLCVTASVDNLSFHRNIELGSVVHLEAKVTRTFNTSLEVYVKAWSENPITQNKIHTHEAFFTFVAIGNEDKRPIAVAPIQPQTEEEKALYENASKRRLVRLLLAKKIQQENINFNELLN